MPGTVRSSIQIRARSPRRRLTTTHATMTIGIDLGDRKSHICVLDADGQVIGESQIATKPEALRARFEGLAPARIALEVGGHSAWISEL